MLVGIAAALMMRNIGGFEGQGTRYSIPIIEVLRCATLQMATLSGIFIALVASSIFVENTRTRNNHDLFSELETDPRRRWLVQLAVVLAVMAVASVVLVGAPLILVVLGKVLRGNEVVFDFTGFGGLRDALLHALPVWLLFAAGSVCLARAIKSGAIAAVGIGMVAIMNLLVIQHLVPSGLEKLVPTAWVGQWMRLTGEDYGVAYYWTTGAFADGRGLSGWFIVVSLILCCGVGIRLTRGNHYS